MVRFLSRKNEHVKSFIHPIFYFLQLFYKMENIIQEIFRNELEEELQSIQPIEGLGAVNLVFDIQCKSGNYIIRCNPEEAKKIEFQKEKWCIEKAIKLGIPSPEILKIGIHKEMNFMIQNKIQGINGSLCSAEEKIKIWETLGKYSSIFNQIPRFEIKEVEDNIFHKNWQAKLLYNIKELNEHDSLLRNNVLTQTEQTEIKKALSSLKDKLYKVGLIHGDLCPRNVIWSNGEVYLLDWGTAGINIVPHTEIGIVLMEKEASEIEFQSYLKGLGLSNLDYKKIEKELSILNLLHRLDKYRWATDHHIEEITDYEERIRSTFEKIINFQPF